MRCLIGADDLFSDRKGHRAPLGAIVAAPLGTPRGDGRRQAAVSGRVAALGVGRAGARTSVKDLLSARRAGPRAPRLVAQAAGPGSVFKPGRRDRFAHPLAVAGDAERVTDLAPAEPGLAGVPDVLTRLIPGSQFKLAGDADSGSWHWVAGIGLSAGPNRAADRWRARFPGDLDDNGEHPLAGGLGDLPRPAYLHVGLTGPA